MKKFLLLTALLLLAGSGQADDPQPGDDRQSVLKQLGKPRGRMRMGDRETLVYDRGLVELSTGTVSKVKLVTAEEVAAREAARAEAARAAEAAWRERVAAGEKARDALLDDEALTTNSPAAQVAAWQQFQREHPDVAPPAEFQQALAAQQAAERKAAEAAALAAARQEPKPRLSASKRRKLSRSGTEDEPAPPAPTGY